MQNVIDLDNVKDIIEGIGDQMSTAVNNSAIRHRMESSENLLDNWYFKNPVNQRRVTGNITAKGYFIDRWKLIDGSVTVADDGLVLDGVIQQVLEYDYTDGAAGSAVALTSDGELIECEYSPTDKIFQIEATGQTITAAKLEIGTHQTLAQHDGSDNWVMMCPAPDYYDELGKCQRYLFVEWPNRSHGYSKFDINRSMFCIVTKLIRKPIIGDTTALLATRISNAEKTVPISSASVLFEPVGWVWIQVPTSVIRLSDNMEWVATSSASKTPLILTCEP